MSFRKAVSKLASTRYAVTMAAVLVVGVLASRFTVPVLVEAKSHAKVLIVGGGTSHDFAKNYQEIDSQILSKAGDSVRYIDSWAAVADGLKGTDVLIQASNQIPPPDATTRQAIMDFVNAGGGLLIVHAGLWFNWPDWPDYNKLLVGGGSHSHDKLGEFEVTVTHPEHPIMKGVPATFKIHDELYHEEVDAAGSPIEVLATATSPVTGKTFPSVWIVNEGHGKIVCIAPGHDAESHNNPAYTRLLINATQWLAKKK